MHSCNRQPRAASRARGQTIVNGPQPPRNAGVINFHPGVPETASFPFSIWSSLLVRNSRSRDETLLGYLSFAGHPGLRATIASNISRIARHRLRRSRSSWLPARRPRSTSSRAC